MRIDIRPLQEFDIGYQFRALKADGLFTARSVREEEIYSLAKSRGYDSSKGLPTVTDGFGFQVELIRVKWKKVILGEDTRNIIITGQENRYPSWFL